MGVIVKIQLTSKTKQNLITTKLFSCSFHRLFLVFVMYLNKHYG